MDVDITLPITLQLQGDVDTWPITSATKDVDYYVFHDMKTRDV
jgi:hypothetical protein